MISKTNFSGDCLNGPTGIVYELVKQLREKKVNFYLLNYEPSDISKIGYILKLVKTLIFSKNCIINVHTDGYIIPFITFMLSKINKRNTYYLTVHGLQIVQNNILKFKNRKNLEKITIKKFENIICVSEMLKDDISKIYNRDKKVFVINNGIRYVHNINKIEPYPEKHKSVIKFIFVGGIKKEKGIFEIVELFKYLKENLKDKICILDIYGSEDVKIKDYFYAKIKNYNLDKLINYKGIEKNKTILYEEYSKYDFNLCLSIYDTFNVSVVESMSVGTPPIVSRKCGASYIIKDYKDGFVVDLNGDYKVKICNIIKDYIENPKKFIEVRKNCMVNSKKFEWDKVCDKYIDLFCKEEKNYG